MRTAIVTIKGICPYGQSAPIKSIKKTQERSDEFEARTWRERTNCDEDGNVIISAQSFKNALSSAASYLSMRVPGKGQATYSKHFKAGLLIVEPLALGIKRDDMLEKRLFVPSDGKTGGSKRVWKSFPYTLKWGGVIKVLIIDPAITDEVFEQHLSAAGQFVGVGFWRPERNGSWGRFSVEKVSYCEGLG